MATLVIITLALIALRQRRTIRRMRVEVYGPKAPKRGGRHHRRAKKAQVQESPVVEEKAQQEAPVVEESPLLWKGPSVDLHPVMPTPVALKDMPQQRIMERRAASREQQEQLTKIMQLETKVREHEAHTCTFGEDQVEALLEAHYREVFASPEKRAELRSFLDAADDAYQLRNDAGVPVLTNRERRAAEKVSA